MSIGMLTVPVARGRAANEGLAPRDPAWRMNLVGVEGSAEELHLWQRYTATGDTAARRRLIERYLPLSRAIAASLYAKRPADDAEFSDYMQYGTVGLIEAVDSFDWNRGVRFNTFATYRIQGAIRNSIANFSERREQAGFVYRLKKERMASAKQADDVGDVTALSALSFLLEDCGLLVGEHEAQYVEHFYGRFELQQLKQQLVAVVGALPEQERRVVTYHYFQNLEFTEIAHILDLSKGRISQIHKRALDLMREAQPLSAC